jgi:ABC-2 type transport system ATP-binding protein
VPTTHYLEEADALADRVAVIDNGALVALGKPTELKERVLGEPVMVVEATNVTDEALAARRAIYPTAQPTEHGIEIPADSVSIYEIGDCLRRFDVEIRSTSTKQVSLDDVFLELTGKDLRE